MSEIILRSISLINYKVAGIAIYFLPLSECFNVLVITVQETVLTF